MFLKFYPITLNYHWNFLKHSPRKKFTAKLLPSRQEFLIRNLLAFSHSSQIVNTLIQCVLFLVRCDWFQNVVNNPCDHMFLGNATIDILALNLVVQTFLNFIVDHHGTLSVGGFQLKGNVFFLGVHEQNLTFGTPLFLLFRFDGIGQLFEFGLTTFLPFALDSLKEAKFITTFHILKLWLNSTYVNFLVAESSNWWT